MNSTGLEVTGKIFGEIEEIEDEVQRRFNSFKNFHVITHPPLDHHFLTYKKDRKKILLGSPFSQRIEGEWSFLEKNIPNSIFIRAYEQRSDLMRAAIIGPPDTPYHHGLFFFDILFPRNYPSNPPMLQYHSYGLDLNPNLRPDGRVCLISLETGFACQMQNWYECNKKEKWNPQKSTISDVLHTIQNLILSSKPNPRETFRFYLYNESESHKYNRAFGITCEKIIRVLREPPLDFKDLVAGHFRERAHPILLKFKEKKDDSELMLSLFMNLYQAFELNGAYCMHHLGFLSSRDRSTAETEEGIRNSGLLVKVSNRVKKNFKLN